LLSLRRLTLLFYWLFCGLASASEFSDPPATPIGEQRSRPLIHFYCSVKSQNKLFHAYEDLYRQVFNQLNYDFQMSYVPSLRGISELSSGKADGSCGRHIQTSKTAHYRNLIRIEVAAARSELSLWSSGPKGAPSSRDSLLTTDYKIGIVRGSSAAKRFINQHQLSATELTSLTLGLKMLHAGRLDLLFATNITIPAVLEKEPTLKRPYKALILEQTYLYPYLTRKHQSLAARFTRELQLALADPLHKIHKFSNLKPLHQ